MAEVSEQTGLTARGRAIAALTAPGGPFEIAPAEVRGIPMRVFTGGPQTLREVVESSRGFGDRDCLVYEDQRWTFEEHYRIVAGLARRLAESYGLSKGNRVAIAARNYPEWSMAFWAIQAAGLVAVPLNAWWTGLELEYALRDSGARVLFADGERVETLRPHLPELGLTTVIEIRGDREHVLGVEHWEDVLAALPADASLPEVAVTPEDDATILYTSGTTGRPKGAVGSHRNHCTNIMCTALAGVAGQFVAAGGPPPPPEPGAPQPGGLSTFPLFHIAGITGLCAGAALGTKLALMYKWDPVKAVELIRRERLSSVSGVPTVMRSLLEAAASEPEAAGSLVSMAMGGAPIPPEIIRRVDRQFASAVAPADGYGLTETTSAVVVNAGEDYVTHPDSVGTCVPVADVRVADPASLEDVPEGEIGELWFRGPHVVRGYWNNPKATAEAFIDGWFRTGDLGHVTDGWVYVVDRIKDVVIRGGENVYCAEVEAALFEHPGVADAAVIGLPHRSLGEEVAAVVTPAEGATLTAEELRAHVGERLAAFKVPTHVLISAEPLPRTATGKVLKRDLRKETMARMEGTHA
ncbi:MAG: AMP-binding protein [Streptosporangiales bacterium]|nr:AMP-binding protein [Streptosporangiales bacterium]